MQFLAYGCLPICFEAYKPQRKGDTMNEFLTHLPAIVDRFGAVVKRSDLLAYCVEHGLIMPVAVTKHKEGWGLYNLTPFLNAPTSATPVEPVEPVEVLATETDEEIENRINERFSVLSTVGNGVVNGDYKALIVSGNPGLGKTFTLEQTLEAAQASSKVRFTKVSGFTTATGLFRLLHDHKEKGNVLMFDDCDSVFGNETALNLLKAALDTTDSRMVAWHSEKKFEDEAGETLPKSFEFEGSVIFVTNVDFEKSISAGNRLAPHLAALISRSFYLDLNLVSKRDLMARIAGVVRRSDMLARLGLSVKAGDRILAYLEEASTNLRERSLRTVVKLAQILKASNTDTEFVRVANATCCRR